MELICGDVLESLRNIPEKSHDCIVTSPPYNIGIKYGSGVNDNKPREEYLNWILEIMTECKRILTDEGSVFVNMGYTNVDPWIHMDVARRIGRVFHLQNNFTWVKNVSVGENSWGHYKPINSKRFVNVTNESVFHFTKSGSVEIHRKAVGVPYADKSNLTRKSKDAPKEDKRCRGNTWFIPYKTIQTKKDHPATFPVELPEMCIKLCGGTRVLDPFVGTGTTLLAAKNLGAEVYTGIDISPEYLGIARERIS